MCGGGGGRWAHHLSHVVRLWLAVEVTTRLTAAGHLRPQLVMFGHNVLGLLGGNTLRLHLVTARTRTLETDGGEGVSRRQTEGQQAADGGSADGRRRGGVSRRQTEGVSRR